MQWLRRLWRLESNKNNWGQSKNKRDFELTVQRMDVNKKRAELNEIL